MPPKAKDKRANTVGANIQTAREERGLSRDELGKRVNLTRVQIYKHEVGHSKLSFEVYLRICTALGVDLDAFLDGASDAKGLRDTITSFERAIR